MNGPEPVGMKVWVTPPGKEPQPVEVHTEGKGNMAAGMEEGDYKYHLWPRDQLQKQGLSS